VQTALSRFIPLALLLTPPTESHVEIAACFRSVWPAEVTFAVVALRGYQRTIIDVSTAASFQGLGNLSPSCIQILTVRVIQEIQYINRYSRFDLLNPLRRNLIIPIWE
jgi:hypothetical protein